MQSSDQTAAARRKGSDPLLAQSGFAVERMPMLGVVFDRLTASLVEGMRVLTRATTTFSVERIAPAGLFETLAAAEGSVAAILSSPELECRSLAAFDKDFVFALVRTLLGWAARDSDGPPTPPFTTFHSNPPPH